MTQPSVKHQQVGHEEGEPSCTPSPLTFCSTPRGRSTPPRGRTSTDTPSGLGGGTPVACVGISVDIHVGSSVVVNRLGHGWPDRGPVGLRSLPAKQHAPKARPHRPRPVAGGRRWSRSSAIEACGALDLTASLPHLNREPWGDPCASTPGGDIPRLEPSSKQTDHPVYRVAVWRLTPAPAIAAGEASK